MRRLVVGDIHGCLNTFRKLLDKTAVTFDDELYLLGDYIDRGPDSSGVLDEVIALQQRGYRVCPIRGNHEENLLNATREYDPETLEFYVRRFNSNDLLHNGMLKTKYFDFMRVLPYFIELSDFYLVHAGINFNIDNPFDDKVALLELRKTEYNKSVACGRRIVYGHQPTYLKDILKARDTQSPLLPLDNGCVYTMPHKVYDYKQLGNLVCLNLDSMELYIVKNEDVLV